MIVYVKKEDEVEFIGIMTHKSDYFTAYRENKYHIKDKDFDLVKHIAKRVRG